ncbi:MAG: hypothetical protein AAB368_07225, partial [bacterium]
MPHHYGYIRTTEGADGDHVDCYIGPDPDAQDAYVVRQRDPRTGKYDEDKVMLGFGSEAEARAAFLAARDDGHRALGDVVKIPMGEFRNRVREADGGPVRKELWSGAGNHPQSGDSFSVGPGAVGGHTFVVGQLKDGVYVADPEHPRVNPYEAIFLKRGVSLLKYAPDQDRDESGRWTSGGGGEAARGGWIKPDGSSVPVGYGAARARGAHLHRRPSAIRITIVAALVALFVVPGASAQTGTNVCQHR